MKKFLKGLGYALGFLVFLLAVLFGFTQSKLFKERLRAFLVSTVASNTSASLSLGTIGGNFFTGFTIDSLALHIGDEEFISTGRVAITYNLLSISRKTVLINSLSIENPRIALRRGEDGIWNIDKLGQPSAEIGETSPFDWTIRVRKLAIIDGSIAVKDLKSLSSPEHQQALPHQVEYHDISLFNLNLQSSGDYSTGSAHLRIDNASFQSTSPPFHLGVQGDFEVTPEGVKVRDVFIQSSNSRVKLTASLEKVNLFDGISLERLHHKPVRMSLLADEIDLDELKQFISPIDFLNGSAYVRLDAAGEFGNLSLSRLDVQTYNTSIKLTGTLQNLHRPEDLFIKAEVRDGQVTPGDADRLLPPFQIPRFGNVGTLPFNCEFVGTPLNFTARVSVAGDLGNFETETKINLEKELMEYDCTFQSHNFQLAKLLNLPVHGILTSQGTIKGEGTSFRNMTCTGQIFLDSSIVQGIILTRSEISLNAQNQQMQLTANLSSLDAKSDITIEADFKDPHTTGFAVDASMTNLDLATLLNDRRYQSELTFRTSASGKGSDIDDLSGIVKISFSESSFREYEFSDENVLWTFDQHTPQEKEIRLISPVADVKLTGAFSFSHVLDRLNEEYEHIAQTIQERSSALKGLSTPPPAYRKNASPSEDANFDFVYSCVVKNLRPLSIFLGGTPFNARGSLQGTILSRNTAFSVTCSTSISELFVGTADQGAFIDEGTLTFAATSIPGTQIKQTRGDFLEHLSLDVSAFSRYGSINKQTFDNTLVKIFYKENKGHYVLTSTVDSLFSLTTDGFVSVSRQTYEFALDTLGITFGSVFWKNDSTVNILLDPTGLRVAHGNMKKGHETLSFAGSLQPDGVLDAQLALRNLDLAAVGEYLGVDELAREQSFTGNLDLEMGVQGSVASPRMHLRTSCNNVAYRGKSLGSLAGMFNYENQSLAIDIAVGDNKGLLGTSTPTPPTVDLTVKGDIPINLALSAVDNRFPEKPINLLINSGSFEIEVLDPLLSSFDELQGRLSGEVRVEGTPAQPAYKGAVTFTDVRFLFVPNNLHYLLQGRLEASGERIHLAGVQLSNSPRDRRDGVATISGSIVIRNFAIDSFDLRANGQLLFIKESSRRALKTLYGTLFAATGSGGLHYRGSFERSFLSGTIAIRDANLVFPPTSESTYPARETPLNYVIIDDTSRNDFSRQKLSEQFYGNTGENGGTAFATNRFSASVDRTIWDGMEYEVEIETQGTTEIRMIFNQATNEELFAGLEGKVTLQHSEKGARIIGEIAVSDRSYYNFFKRFSASGTLKFVGDPDNPELNIKATYEGVRDTSTTATKEEESHDQKVLVTLDITGTRYEPKLTMSMTIDGDDWALKGGDVQADAISFILTGKFREDLSSREESDIATTIGASAGSSILYGLPSQMLSGVLSDYLRNELGFIRSAELTFQGGSLQESADLRLSGELGLAYWRFGGKIFNDIGNANVSLQLSMGEVFSTPLLRNLFIELERKVEGAEDIDKKKLTNAARIFYKFSF